MDNLEIKKLADEISQGINAIREKNEILEKQGAALESRWNELKETIENVQRKVDQVEVEVKRNRYLTSERKEHSPEFKAFLEWVRKGTAIPEEFKVQKLSDNTLGGYLVSPEITKELLKEIAEYSPIRNFARVITTSKEQVQFRKETGSFSAVWTADETGIKSETTGWTFGLETIHTHESYALVDISNWLLEDSDFDLEAELNQKFGERFGVAEGAAFIYGNAVGKPEGILTNASVNYVPSGNASAITADGMFKLYFSLKSAYAKQARFLMNRNTLYALSILKDSQGNYLLRRLGESPAWNILGVEVVECPDMPDIASNAFPVVFGDLRRGYLIVDRLAIAILRDPFTQATSGCVRFIARKRVGGQVIMPEAILKLKIATS